MEIRLGPKKWRLALLILIAVGIVYFLYLVRAVLGSFFAGGILAFLLHPFVVFGERRGLSRNTSILLVYAGLGIVLAVFVFAGLPRLAYELNEFADSLPGYSRDLNAFIDHLQVRYDRAILPAGVRQVIDETLVSLEQEVIRILRGIARSFPGLFSQMLSIILAPILAFYLLKDADNFRAKFLDIFPNTCRGDAYHLLREIGRVLERFARGELLVSAIIGVLVALGMFFLGVKFALIIGFIAGITELIPYFGPVIGAIPAVGFALLKSKATAVYAAILILIIQQLESNLIAPRILGDSVGLHPLLVIFALLAGGELFGFWGLILAVPAAGVLRVTAAFLFRKLIDREPQSR